MNSVSMVFVGPVLRDYHAALVAAAHHCPGGRLLREDIDGIRRRVARTHRITPEDMQRWYDALPRKALRGLTSEAA